MKGITQALSSVVIQLVTLNTLLVGICWLRTRRLLLLIHSRSLFRRGRLGLLRVRRLRGRCFLLVLLACLSLLRLDRLLGFCRGHRFWSGYGLRRSVFLVFLLRFQFVVRVLDSLR